MARFNLAKVIKFFVLEESSSSFLFHLSCCGERNSSCELVFVCYLEIDRPLKDFCVPLVDSVIVKISCGGNLFLEVAVLL